MQELHFKGGMAMLAEATHMKVTEDKLRVFATLLKDQDGEDFLAACQHWVLNESKWPTVADLLRLCRNRDAPRDEKDAAVIAWDLAFRAIGRTGMYRSITFEDPVITATIRAMGGWIAFCEHSPAERTWLRKEFEATYRSFANQRLNADQCRRLVGVIDQENALMGYNEREQVTVGKDRITHDASSVRKLPAPVENLVKTLELPRDCDPIADVAPVPSKDEQLKALRDWDAKRQKQSP